MSMKMDRVGSRNLSLLSRFIRQIRAIYYQIDITSGEIVLPHGVERIVDVRRVLGVEDSRVTIVKEQRRVGQIPAECAVCNVDVKISSEGVVLFVALEVGDVPRNHRSEVRRTLINTKIAAVVGIGRWSACFSIVSDDP